MTKKMIALVMVSLLFGAAGIACAEKAESKPADNTVATVGARSITTDEMQVLLEKRSGRPATAVEKRQLLDEMVNFELLLAAAQQAGYANDPELQTAYRRMLAGKYREVYLQPRLANLTVTDSEIQRFYEGHRHLFATPRSVRAAVIKIDIPPKASVETKDKLRQRAEAARSAALALDPATVTFGSVAVEYSSDQASRFRGGDTGWLRTGQSDAHWPEVVKKAILALTGPGEVSPLLALDDGFYLFKLIEAKDGAARPLKDVRGEVFQRALRDKQADTERAFFAELQKGVPVTVNEKLLETIKSPMNGAAQSPPALPRR